MTKKSESDAVPEYFLVKMRTSDRWHYIFCEMVASCSYSFEGEAIADGDGQAPFLPREALEELIRVQKSAGGDKQIKDVVVLSDAGDANSPWTVRSARKQSGRDPSDN